MSSIILQFSDLQKCPLYEETSSVTLDGQENDSLNRRNIKNNNKANGNGTSNKNTSQKDSPSAWSTSKLIMDTLAERINRPKSKTIAILGAGVSVSSGIPDFRSAEGLYKQVEDQYPGLLKKGQHLFDASILHSAGDGSSSNSELFFRMRSAYFTFMGYLKEMADQAKPSPTHYFLKKLKDSGKLQRIYTQNIDGLEERAGMNIAERDPIIVNVHGNLSNLACTLCMHTTPFSDVLLEQYKQGKEETCPSCRQRSQTRISSGRRSMPIGLLTPAILLYNDHSNSSNSSKPATNNYTCGYRMSSHCDRVGAIMSRDTATRPIPEIVLVIGTSCKVIGIKKWIKILSSHFRTAILNEADVLSTGSLSKLKQTKLTDFTPAGTNKSLLALLEKPRWIVYINRTPLPQKEWMNAFDLQIIGEADDICQYLENWITIKNRKNVPKKSLTIISQPTKEKRNIILPCGSSPSLVEKKLSPSLLSPSISGKNLLVTSPKLKYINPPCFKTVEGSPPSVKPNSLTAIYKSIKIESHDVNKKISTLPKVAAIRKKPNVPINNDA